MNLHSLAVPLVLLLGASAAGAAEVETVAVDFTHPSALQVARVATNDAFRFDGKRSCLQLPADLPKKIGQRDFSLAFEFRPDDQTDATAYILEHHRDFPWTGLFVAIENNKILRFRLKDLPHCDIRYDIGGLMGDGAFHQVVLNRRGQTLEAWLDGALAISQEKPELVDLDIDYAGNLPTVGSHCSREGAFYKGELRKMEFHIGECLTAAQIQDLFAATPSGKAFAERREAARATLKAQIEQLRNGDREARREAIEALRTLDPSGRATLSEFRDDPDPEVRETIRELLATPAPSAPAAPGN